MPHRPDDDVEFVDLTDDAGGAEPPDPDRPAIAARPPWWQPRRVVIGMVVVALGLGFLFGYLAGARPTADHSAGDQSGPPAGGPTGPTQALTVGRGTPAQTVDALEQTGFLCGVQSGPRQLQLGVEVTNSGAQVVELEKLTAALPLGGLRLTAAGVGSACGQVAPPTQLVGYDIGPGQRAFLLATFDVLSDDCPRPLPVRFDLGVQVGAVPSTINLAGFADLGNIALASC